MKRQISTMILCVFIASWWGCFLLPELTNPTPLVDDSVLRTPPSVIRHEFLSQISKKDLLDALTGDTDKMTSLMLDWDADAQVLEALGMKEIERLSTNELSTILKRPVQTTTEECKYYPQSFLAAGILLALVPPETVTALPAGFRTQEHIYPRKLTNLIPQDASYIFTESATPPGKNIAFVSPLSHPPTLRTLKSRGVQLVDLGNVTSIENLDLSITLCGKWTGQQDKARLLSLFIKSTVMALENRLKLSKRSDVAYLEYRNTLAVPTKKTLAGSLIEKLGLSKFSSAQESGWTTPIEFEELESAQPKTLIFAISHNGQKEELLQKRVIANLINNGSEAYFVKRSTYETPSQFFLLGYFDLCSILALR